MRGNDDGKGLHGRDGEENNACLHRDDGDGGSSGGGKNKKVKMKDDYEDEEYRPAKGLLGRMESMSSAAVDGRPRRLMIIMIVLLFLALLALVLLIAVIVLAVWPSCTETPSPIRTVCSSTPGCLTAGAALLGGLNGSVDACADFYEFACGGSYPSSWSSVTATADIDSRRSIGVFEDARLEFMRRIREIVDILEYTSNFRSPRWQVKAFYQSCMDIDGLDSAGDDMLKRHIEQLKGWKSIGTWQRNVWDWPKVLRDLHSLHGVFPFFRVDVVPDEINPIQNVLQVSPSGLGLPHYSYYFRSPDDKVIVAYRKLMSDLASLLGAVGDRPATFADDVFHFEKRIAEFRLGFRMENVNRQSRIYSDTAARTKITISDLRQISQRIYWIDHLKAILPKAYISENTPVYVTDSRYLTDVSTILSTTDSGSLNSYLVWTLVLHYAPALSLPYRKAVDMYYRAFSGATKSRPRWEYCIESTYSVFSLALTSFYVQADVSSRSFVMATDLYRRMRSSFVGTLENVNWMDDRMQTATVDRIKSLKDKVSYRYFDMDDTALNVYYDEMSVLKTDFLLNIQNGALFHRAQLEKAIFKTSRNYLELDMLTKEDVYDRDLKEIVLWPFLLRRDFDHPKYLLYGSLGSLFGYGLARAFEDGVETFNRGVSTYGANRTLMEFSRYRQCIVDNYAQHFQIDVNRTVDNNIADVLGVSQAYKAFLEFERLEKMEPLIPGTTLSAEQLFFVSYAQTMCSVSRLEQLENDLKLANHPPSKYRLIATLSQVPEFADAFKCPRGSPSNPISRCSFL